MIDWKKLFVYLKAKYKVDIIYYAVWYVDKYQLMYEALEKIGYKMLYKETIQLPDGRIKWNVDIDIAIKSIMELRKDWLQKAYLISNDWDYNTLIKVLIEEWVFGWLIVPDKRTASKLIKKFNRIVLDLQEIRHKIKKI